MAIGGWGNGAIDAEDSVPLVFEATMTAVEYRSHLRGAVGHLNHVCGDQSQSAVPPRYRQSPSTAATSASAATAAVSARRMRGPSASRTTFGALRSAARSSSANPPSGP